MIADSGIWINSFGRPIFLIQHIRKYVKSVLKLFSSKEN